MADAAKKTMAELRDSLRPVHDLVGGPWRHYKTGDLYTVVGWVVHEATQEPLVVYRQLNTSNDVMFARPYREWQENVAVERDGALVQVPRFVRDRS